MTKSSSVSNTAKKEIEMALVKDLVSIPHAAKQLRHSPQSLRNAIADQRIPAEAVVNIDDTFKVLRWSKIPADIGLRKYKPKKKVSKTKIIK